MTGRVTTHRYSVERVKKQYTCYELEPNQKPVLTNLIRVEKDRQFHRGKGFDKWLRMKEGSNWSLCKPVTGLKFTKYENVFYGDIKRNGRNKLLVFIFSNDKKRLIIDYYSEPHYQLLKPKLDSILKKYSEEYRRVTNGEQSGRGYDSK